MTYLELQIATVSTEYPDTNQFQRWVEAALAGRLVNAEVVIRLVDDNESSELNRQYRHKQGPTNILSFPFDPPPGVASDLLGDLVICAPIVVREAQRWNKPVADHWAHITIHGILHLLGYDHEDEPAATQMESLEIEILNRFNIANPYLEESAQ